MFVLTSVSRVYGTGAQQSVARHDVALGVDRGEFVASTGPSGRGKTTLRNLVAGLDAPTSGGIRVGGRDLSQLAPSDLADFRLAKIAFVFQQFSLIPGPTAAENVELPLLFRKVVPAAAQLSSRAASNSASRSRGRWRETPRAHWPTSRPQISITKPTVRA